MIKRFRKRLHDCRGVSMVQGVLVMNFMCIAMLSVLTQTRDSIGHMAATYHCEIAGGTTGDTEPAFVPAGVISDIDRPIDCEVYLRYFRPEPE